MNIYNMVAVVQCYINHRKNIEVDINTQQFNDPRNILKLQQAYETAIEWFKNNNGTINK